MDSHPPHRRREDRPARRRRQRRARLRAELPAAAPARRGGDAGARWPSSRKRDEQRARHEAKTVEQAREIADRARPDRAALRRQGGPDRLALRLGDADRHRRRALEAAEDPRRPPQGRHRHDQADRPLHGADRALQGRGRRGARARRARGRRAAARGGARGDGGRSRSRRKRPPLPPPQRSRPRCRSFSPRTSPKPSRSRADEPEPAAERRGASRVAAEPESQQ